MRSREEIMADFTWRHSQDLYGADKLLEVLLDIRDLLQSPSIKPEQEEKTND